MPSSKGSTSSRKGEIGEIIQKSRSRPTTQGCDGVSGPTGIVLIDDDWIALSRLREIIEQGSDLVVVAACRCAEGAMLAVQQYRPAVLILDVRLPDRNGIELIRDIIAISETKVIVFTAALSRAEIVSALRSGAEAIVFKHEPAATLVSSVREVLAEEALLPNHWRSGRLELSSRSPSLQAFAKTSEIGRMSCRALPTND
jgi:DNA-binding NarL/FixJ family response regulator